MFDKRSPRWINICRGATVTLFFVFSVAGLFFGLVDEINQITPVSEIPGIAIFAWMISGALIGYIQLICNMLIIQTLEGVNAIRTMTEKSEKQTQIIQGGKNYDFI